MPAASPFHVPLKQREQQAEPPASAAAPCAASSGGSSARGKKSSPGSARGRRHSGFGVDSPSHTANGSSPHRGPNSNASSSKKGEPRRRSSSIDGAKAQQAAKLARQQMAAMLGTVAESRLLAAEEVHAEQLRLLQAQSLEREREANELRRFETERADTLSNMLNEVETEGLEAARVRDLEIQKLKTQLEASQHEANGLRVDWAEAMAQAERAVAERDALAAQLLACRKELMASGKDTFDVERSEDLRAVE